MSQELTNTEDLQRNNTGDSLDRCVLAFTARPLCYPGVLSVPHEDRLGQGEILQLLKQPREELSQVSYQVYFSFCEIFQLIYSDLTNCLP